MGINDLTLGKSSHPIKNSQNKQQTFLQALVMNSISWERYFEYKRENITFFNIPKKNYHGIKFFEKKSFCYCHDIIFEILFPDILYSIQN